MISSFRGSFNCIYVVASVPVSEFFVSFTDPNKQLPNEKSVFKFLSWEPKKYIDLLLFCGIETSFFIKQCPLKFMSGNKWWPKKVGAKLLSDLVPSSIFSSDIPLGVHGWIRVVAWKYLMYFISGINTKRNTWLY